MKTKAEIRAWLKAEHISREELAEKVGVSRGTIDNWFSKKGRDIPVSKQNLIELLMRDSAIEKKAVGYKIGSRIVGAALNEAEYNLCLRAAMVTGEEFTEFAHTALITHALNVLEKTPRDTQEIM